MDGLTDGQVAGGLLFVAVPLVLLGFVWLERRGQARRVARVRAELTHARGALAAAAERDQARREVLARRAVEEEGWLADLAWRKLRELGVHALYGSSLSWTGERDG